MGSIRSTLEKAAKDDAILSFDPAGTSREIVEEFPLSAITPDPNQPRKDLGDLSELASSIKEHGVIAPIIVEELQKKGTYRILAGERRFAASKKAHCCTIRCIVRTYDDHARRAIQIIENIHRKELNPLEEAEAIDLLQKDFDMSQSALAKKLGRKRETINQTLRILTLPDGILKACKTSYILTRAVLLELAKVKDSKKQAALFKRALAGELTVRDARQHRAKPTAHQRTSAVTKKFSDDLGTATLTFSKKHVSKKDILALLAKIIEQVQKS